MWLWQFMSRRSKVNFTVTSQCSVKNVLDNIQSYSSGWTTRLVHWGGNSSVFMCKWQEVRSTEPCVCVSKVVIGDPVWSVGSRCGLHPLHRSGSFVPHTCVEHTLIINAGLCRPNPKVQTSLPLRTHRLHRCTSKDFFKCWCCIQMLFRWFHFPSWKVIFFWLQCSSEHKGNNTMTFQSMNLVQVSYHRLNVCLPFFIFHMATTKQHVYQILISDFFKTWEDVHLNFLDDSEHITVGMTEVQKEEIWIQPHNCFTKITSQIFCLHLKVTTKCFMLEHFFFVCFF